MKITRVLKLAFSPKRMNLPNSLILLVTGRCNASCSFCFFKDSLNKNLKELTLEEYNKLSKSLNRIFRMHVSGGEPFLREDLPEICEIFSKNNQVDELAIPTNGLMPAQIKEMTKEIIEKCPDTHIMISLSLDGLLELHNKLRGRPEAFDNVMASYHQLMELKQIYPDLRVHVTTTISKYNYHQLPELIEVVKKKMPGLNSHNFEFVRDKPDKLCQDLPTISQCQNFEKIHRQLVKETKNHFNSWIKSKLANLVKNYKFHLLVEILRQKKQLITCDAGKTIGVIDWNGNVYLCELLPKVGNIRDGEFSQIWHSEKAKQQRKYISEKRCFCTHSCFQGANILFRPKNYFKIILHWFKYG